jgi:ankyrin repeat protein
MNAAQFGSQEAVKLLLSYPGMQPYAINYALKQAVRNNHPEVVRLLLADERVDPNYDDEIVMQTAASMSDLATVAALLTDKRVRVTKENVISSVSNKNRGVFALLLSKLRDRHLDDAIFMRRLFQAACEVGTIESVELLLDQPDVKVDAYESKAFIGAVDNRNYDVVELLLEDGRLNPATKGDSALKTAISLRDLDMIEILLSDDRVDVYGDVVRAFLLDPSSLLTQVTDMVSLLMSNYRAFKFVPPYVIDYARSNLASKGHYDRLLREILLSRMDIGYYYKWLIEQQKSKMVSTPSKILVMNAAKSFRYKMARHNSEYFTAYRAFLMLGPGRPSAQTVIDKVRTETGVTNDGLHRAQMLLDAYEAGRKIIYID